MSTTCNKSLGAALVGITNDAGEVLLTRSVARPTVWQPAGGHREVYDLTPVSTVVREVHEELGATLDPHSVVPVLTRTSDTEKGASIHFLRGRASMPQGIRLQSAEVLEARFFPLAQALRLPTLPATSAFLWELAS